MARNYEAMKGFVEVIPLHTNSLTLTINTKNATLLSINMILYQKSLVHYSQEKN